MRYVTTLLLLFAACVARAVTVPEAEAWVSPLALTSNQVASVRLLKPVTIKGNQHVLKFAGWGKLEDISLLDTPIPQSALDQVYGAGVVTNMTLRDFSLYEQVVVPDVGEPFALFMLSANYAVPPMNKTRQKYTSADDGMQWLGLTAPFGITLETALTDEQRQALLPTGE